MNASAELELASLREARSFARTRRIALIESPELAAPASVAMAVSGTGDLIVDLRIGKPGAASTGEARVWLGDARDGILVIDGRLRPVHDRREEERFAAVHGERPTLSTLSVDVVRWSSPGRAPGAFLAPQWHSARAPYRDREADVVEHLNAAHRGLLTRLAGRGSRSEVVRVTSIDADGLVLDVGGRLVFVGFDAPCETSAEADRALLRLAWARDPNSVPPLLIEQSRTVH